MSVEPVTVGGRAISESLIASEVQHHPAPDPASAREAAARALVVRQLLLDEADRKEIRAESGQDELGRTLAPDDARIEALLTEEIRIPDADEETCRRYYDRHPDCFVSPPLVEAAHILIAADPSDSFAVGLATGDARMLIRQLQTEPDRFAELARSRSACPSREQGGKLGQVQPGQMVKAFEDVLFAMPEHTLHPHPIKTRFGVHVIRSSRRIEPCALPFEAVHSRIADYLQEASYRRAVSQYISLLSERYGVCGIGTGGAPFIVA